MGIPGAVREWHDGEGWGVIDSPATPGGCWAHFSMIQETGYRKLSASDEIRFTFEEAEQDGFRFRAVAVWTPGRTTLLSDKEAIPDPNGFHSELTIEFD